MKTDEYTPAENKMTETIDSILNESPTEMKKVEENLTFIDKIMHHNVKKGKKTITVFGAEQFDLSDILKENIWDRSIFTIDTICRMFLNANIEQMKKYLPKKTAKGFEYWWLVILLIIGGVAIAIIMIFLLPQLGKIKLF
jgi:hypothetical protein